MIRSIAVASFSAVTALSPNLASADGKNKEASFPETPQSHLIERSIDLLLTPQAVEFEGFINYGSPIQSTSTNALGQTVVTVSSPHTTSQPIFSTRKVATSGSISDRSMREDVKNERDTTNAVEGSSLQDLMNERDRLKQRLLEVEALIKKHTKE